MRAFLVRHGEVENPEKVVYGRLPGFRLSGAGRAQVERTARWLADRLDGRAARWVSSPLERARETAAILAGSAGSDVEIDPRLQEAGSPFDGLPRRFAPRLYMGRWLDSPESTEKPAKVARRMMDAIRTALSRSEDVIIVSHQFPIQLARLGFVHRIDARPSWLIERTPWAFLRAPCALASVTTLTFAHRGLVDPEIDYWCL